MYAPLSMNISGGDAQCIRARRNGINVWRHHHPHCPFDEWSPLLYGHVCLVPGVSVLRPLSSNTKASSQCANCLIFIHTVTTALSDRPV